jgi:hypothetical protein
MAVERSGSVYETLRVDEEFSLCRIRQEGEPSTVLVVSIARKLGPAGACLLLTGRA